MRQILTCSVALALSFLAGAVRGDKPPASLEDKPACSGHGTTIDFVDTPSIAAKQAKKEGKLVFVLHVSGHFEDPRFT
jgi:hypothetical protein